MSAFISEEEKAIYSVKAIRISQTLVFSGANPCKAVSRSGRSLRRAAAELTMPLILWSMSLRLGVHERLGLRIEDCILPALDENLDWGPLHRDPATQLFLRECYFRRSLRETIVFDNYLPQISRPEEVVFWCERVLPGCLVVLWALDHLASRGIELQKASLALSPRDAIGEPLETAALRKAYHERVQIGELLQPLIAIWRHVASDSTPVIPDLSSIPEPVRRWVAVTQRMIDLLPDSRGLDLVDSIILETLSRRWRRDSWVLGDCFKLTPRGHDIPDLRLWERLLELSGHTPLPWATGGRRRQTLIEARQQEEGSIVRTSFRLTPLGVRVRAGETDALEHMPYCTWVGGRMITNERLLRRDT